MQDFVTAVSAAVTSVLDAGSNAAALAILQAVADEVGSGATVIWGDEPDGLNGEGTVIIQYKGENSDPIDVDVIS